MNERTQLGVAFASPDSRIDQTIMTVNVRRSIKIRKSALQAGGLPDIEWHYDEAASMAGRAADSPIIQYHGGEITLVLRLSATPPGRSSSAGTVVSPATMARSKRRRCGEITSWEPGRGHGFIRDSVTGENFWFSPKQLIYTDSTEDLAIGTKLAFVAAGTAKGKNNLRAAAILVVGEKADGRLVCRRYQAGKRHGWVRVEGEQGNHQLVYVPQRELSGCKVGDILTFAVAANDKGGFASQVERLAEGKAA